MSDTRQLPRLPVLMKYQQHQPRQQYRRRHRPIDIACQRQSISLKSTQREIAAMPFASLCVASP